MNFLQNVISWSASKCWTHNHFFPFKSRSYCMFFSKFVASSAIKQDTPIYNYPDAFYPSVHFLSNPNATKFTSKYAQNPLCSKFLPLPPSLNQHHLPFRLLLDLQSPPSTLPPLQSVVHKIKVSLERTFDLIPLLLKSLLGIPMYSYNKDKNP